MALTVRWSRDLHLHTSPTGRLTKSNSDEPEGFVVAERARFELAEEREPLAGLANRCLGPLDYLSSKCILLLTAMCIKGMSLAKPRRSQSNSHLAYYARQA